MEMVNVKYPSCPLMSDTFKRMEGAAFPMSQATCQPPVAAAVDP